MEHWNRAFPSLFITASITIFFILLPAICSGDPTAHLCKSTDVTTFPERIHVRCSNPANGNIIYFAVSTTNSEHAARNLSTLLAAHMAGKKIIIGYDLDDTSGTSFGCSEDNCRRMLSVGVK